MKMLRIKNGLIIDGKAPQAYKADILMDNGVIVDIQKEPSGNSERTIDAGGRYVLPGFVDAHCHLREPGFEYKEDIASGTRSAARGGFTSIACMPNTNPVIDNAALVHYIKMKAQTQGVVKVFPIGAVTKGQKGHELAEMGELKEAGVRALSDDGHPVEDANLMKLALQYAKNFELLIISHCEDMELANEGVMNEGYMSAILGLRGVTRAAEEVMVAREIILAETLGVPVHIAHVSTRGSIEMIRQAKRRGVKVTCETCPHYFSATEDWVDGYDTHTKVNPPLRTEDDVEAVKEGLKDGSIDIIATDHAPHHRDEKEVEYNLAANGISGFETAFSLAFTHLVKQGVLSMEELAVRMATRPAEILGISGGTIELGKPADLTIVDVDEEYVVNRKEFYSKGKNTPFHGKRLAGRVVYTFVNGEMVVEKGKVIR